MAPHLSFAELDLIAKAAGEQKAPKDNRESILAPLFHEFQVGWSKMTQLSHLDDCYGALRTLKP